MDDGEGLASGVNKPVTDSEVHVELDEKRSEPAILAPSGVDTDDKAHVKLDEKRSEPAILAPSGVDTDDKAHVKLDTKRSEPAILAPSAVGHATAPADTDPDSPSSRGSVRTSSRRPSSSG